MTTPSFHTAHIVHYTNTPHPTGLLVAKGVSGRRPMADSRPLPRAATARAATARVAPRWRP
eukprot:6762567-Prymnesium_polylepis.1